MRFTPESVGMAQKMCNEFVMLCGKNAEAYHIKSGDRMGREAHLQHCTGHYGKLEFIVTDANGNETIDTIESGKAFWDLNLPWKRIVRRVITDPGAAPDPQTFNRWDVLKKEMCTPDMAATPNDIGPFLEHMMFISDNDDVGVAYFLNWLAELYQHPAVKIPSAILMYSKRSRMGKTILYEILSRVFAPPMVGCNKGADMFSKWALDIVDGKRLIIWNELPRVDRPDHYENLKNFVSERVLLAEGKNTKHREIANCVHNIITTNNADALPLMNKDGRILVLRCEAERRPDAYYRDLAAWMEGPGPHLLAGVLAKWKFPAGWDPYAPVPQTDAVRRTQREARPAVELFVEDLIERRAAPFDKDHGHAADLVEQLGTLYPTNIRGLHLTRISLGRALKTLGAVQVRVDWIKANGTRTTSVPYVWRNVDQWTDEEQPSRQLIDWYAENYK